MITASRHRRLSLGARALFAGGLVGLAFQARAQQAGILASELLRFRHIGVDAGLPSSLVSSIVRDRRGFLWIGTSHGVTRYDGHRFHTYSHQPGNRVGLPTDMVDQVYVDREDVVWAVTPRGLVRYDERYDQFETFMTPPVRASGHAGGEAVVTAVAVAASRMIWVGTSRGLYRLDPATRQADLQRVGTSSPTTNVTTLYEDRRRRLWVGTPNGVYRLDPTDRDGAWTILGDSSEADRIRPPQVMTEDTAGNVWIGTTGGGLVRIAAHGDSVRHFRHVTGDPSSLANDRVRSLAVDQLGRIWVGTENGGLDRLDPSTGDFAHHQFSTNDPSSIGSNSVWALHIDAANALWVGTYSGGLDVAALTASAVVHFRAEPGDTTSLSYNAVPKFAEGNDGRIWVATDGGGLNRFDPATRRVSRFTPANTNLDNPAVVGVVEGRRGDVWVGTWGGGLSEFDPRTRRFTAYTTRNSNLPNNNIIELFEDRSGRLWLGMDSATVAVFDRRTRAVVERYHVAEPRGDARQPVGLIRELADGTVAIGLHDGGLTILDPRTGQQAHYVPAPVDGAALPSTARGTIAGTDVRTLLEEAPGVLWLGTNNGLERVELRSGGRVHFGEADGLPSRFVDGVLMDDAGRLWVSTDRGLARVDPRTREVKVFARGDGLRESEFLRGAALRARDGTLYFGGNQGFDAVHPDRLVENSRKPPVVIAALELFNEPVPVGAPGSPLRRPIDRTDTLTLDHTQNVVTFEFAALDLAAPDRNQYAYRLDGFDRTWQEVGAHYTASYTNLAPGRYTLRVKASNADGVWNEAGATLAIVILPPLWETWWFRLVAGTAVTLAVIALFRFQQRRRMEVALGRQALRDALTGLANRRLFHDRVEHALVRLTRQGPEPGAEPRRIAVLFLDLDGFKAVNDTFGHQAGDRLLQEVGVRLLSATRGVDTVARLGGDEFAVLVENARGPTDATTVADRILCALRSPVRVDDGNASSTSREATVGASAGIAVAELGVDTDTLMRQADAAMYEAKAAGKGHYIVFHPALTAAEDERRALERDLAEALERGELTLAYQPIVALGTGVVQQVEALLRWHHPTRGSVPPARFIPVAESSGLIVRLGKWVLEEACRAAAAWPRIAGREPVGISVNVSARQLLDPALPGHVAAALSASRLPASRLTLEITESVLMRNTPAILATLSTLKDAGVQLAIDDFGTGYSSLRYLQQFPVDVLKIDKSFIDGVARGGRDSALGRTIVALAQTLGLRTVAEGIEQQAQREWLQALGCDLGQGYLFARPLDGRAMSMLLGDEPGDREAVAENSCATATFASTTR